MSGIQEKLHEMLAALVIDTIFNGPLSFILNVFPKEKSSGVRVCGIFRVRKVTSSPLSLLSGQPSLDVA